MTSIKKKMGISFVVSNMATIVNLLLSIILSRMLTPAEIGVFSMAAVIVGIAQVFRDFGVAAYIKSSKELTPEILRAAMGILICSSWFIAALLFILSWPIAIFYRQDGVRTTLQILSVGFIFIPFGSISQAVIGRNLHIEKSAIVTAISTITYFVASLGFAWFGFSYLTMALANLVNIIVSVVAFTVVRPKGLPWIPSFKGWNQVLSFSGGSIVTSISKSIDEAIGDISLGKLSASHLVGIYSRANSTVNICFQAIRPTIDYTALPYLAKAHHSGGNLSNDIVRSTSYLTSLLWPALLATAFYASDIVNLLYGQKWLECAIGIPWLCLALGIRIAFYLVQPALTGIGRPFWAAIPIGSGVLLKIAFILTLFDGSLASFCRSLAFSEIITAVVYIVTSKYVLNMKIIDWWLAVHKSTVIILAVAIVLFLITYCTSGLSIPLLRVLIVAIVMAPTWFALIYLFNHPIKSELSQLIENICGNR